LLSVAVPPLQGYQVADDRQRFVSASATSGSRLYRRNLTIVLNGNPVHPASAGAVDGLNAHRQFSRLTIELLMYINNSDEEPVSDVSVAHGIAASWESYLCHRPLRVEAIGKREFAVIHINNFGGWP
jgi:hypothetical protein